MMMSYADAVEKFGSGLADMMLECEYNEFIRGCTPHKKSLDEIEFEMAEEDKFIEELYRMEEELSLSSVDR